MNQNSIDRIKLYRTILQEYTGPDCHWQGEPIPYRAVYKNGLDGHVWEDIRRNIRDLCIDNALSIELDKYPSTTLITITLTPDA